MKEAHKPFNKVNMIVICVTIILLFVCGILQYYFTWQGIQKEMETRAKIEFNINNEKIAQLKNTVEGAITNMSTAFEQQLNASGDMRPLLQRLIANNSSVLGSCVAFVPGSVKGEPKLYAPYAYRDGETIKSSLLSFDYTQREWFSKTISTGQPSWSEPYTDKGGPFVVVTTYSVPLKNKKGTIMAVLSADIPVSELSQESKNIYASMGLRYIVILLIQAFGLLLIIIIAWRSVKSLLQSKAFAKENIRLNDELSINQRLRTAIIPRNLPCTDNVEVKAKQQMIEAVGGDLYDTLIINDKLHFCIGNVSNKGAAAALSMMITRTAYHTFIRYEISPSRILEEMNKALCEINENQLFGTMFIGVLDLKSGLLRYCNAGHHAPIIIKGAETTTLETTPNVPMGITDWKYEEQQLTLEPDTAIVLYTSGLIEAKNHNGQVLGDKRLALNLRAASEQKITLEKVLERIDTVLKRHMEGQELEDDITAMAIHFKARKS